MKGRKMLEDLGIAIGRMPSGPLGTITDVPGVLVGHATIEEGPYLTGVTVVKPGPLDPYLYGPVAAVHVLNGYGKSLGLMQVMELGVLETPIALTNTLNVGLAHDALITLSLEQLSEQGHHPTSLNPLVLECNDGRLSDIAGRPVGLAHVRAALTCAGQDVAEGAIGAGRGMICHGLKGGIGTASRIISVDGKDYTLGVLALTNHGHLSDLTVGGDAIGRRIQAEINAKEAAEKGSVIILIATDLPLSDRQLLRILKRSPVGLARLGAHVGHGSGEVFLGFSTAFAMPKGDGQALLSMPLIREDLLDTAFRAAIEATEEAALRSMLCAKTTRGYKGEIIYSLWEFMEK